jgi:hypothetical protein
MTEVQLSYVHEAVPRVSVLGMLYALPEVPARALQAMGEPAMA